jgi:xanthine dehydrogenase accessory factor
MLDLAADMLPVLHAGEPVAVVTVTRVARSAPRGVGASMAVARDGRLFGSISGGCVESESVALALAVLATGAPRRAGFGFSDEAAHAAGLACGGSVEVIAYRVDPADAVAIDGLESALVDRAVTLVLDTETGRFTQTGDARLDAQATDAASRASAVGDSMLIPGESGSPDLFVLSHAPRQRLIVVGAGEHAAALCRVATAAGFAVSVCDLWPLMATRERFPDAVEVVAGLPHEYLASLDPATLDARTAVCVLTHDERLDLPALEVALRLPVGFVGAMGARSTVAHRARLLREAGVEDVDLARLHSPLGLHLGGASPAESAVSIVAEIIASRHGGSGLPLADLTGPLHAPVRREHGISTREAAQQDAEADESCATTPVPGARRTAP